MKRWFSTSLPTVTRSHPPDMGRMITPCSRIDAATAFESSPWRK